MISMLVAFSLSELPSAYPDDVPQSPAPLPRPAKLEDRVESLSESHRKLEALFQRVLQENESLSQRLNAMQSQDQRLPRPDDPRTDSPVPGGLRSTEFDDQPPDIRTDEPAPRSSDTGTKSAFFEGFKWQTEDGEYSLNFHSEMQADTRLYGLPTEPADQLGFNIHRMRFIFNGHLSKPIEYNVSIAQGLGDLSLLDAYLNFNYDERFQFRFGRYRSPFGYDSYALSNQFLLTPERSVFAINYGYNRNMQAMLHGDLFDDRVDYAIAIANGPRNSIYDQNGDKDLLTYVNVRPFMECDWAPALRHLNLGASTANGRQNQSPLPRYFRTSTNATNGEAAETLIPSFLVLNPGVSEHGLRSLWEVHAAWYYRQLSLISVYDWGFNDYDDPTHTSIVRLPTSGYHVQFGYFLTGEEVERRTFVSPLRPFDLRAGRRGPGAVEIQARFDHFSVGSQVFTGGLADSTQWTNSVETVDTGVNWYLNKYVKIAFDWQHAMYASPVVYRPGRSSRSMDLFWTRLQLYF